MNRYEIAVIPGDGIGVEVVAEGIKVLDTVAEVHGGFSLDYKHLPWSCQYYLEHGKMMPDDGLRILRDRQSIFLGAVGYPGVPDHVSLWGLLLPIRREFQQYINYRPVKLLPGIQSPLRTIGDKGLDFTVIRENNEGEYSNMGGRIYQGTDYDMAIQNNVFTRHGVERVLRYAFRMAQRQGRRKRLTAATKSNGINYTMPFWDEYVRKISREFPDVEVTITHIDALAAFFVTKPQEFDVVVGSNLFGDILTDLGAAIMGGLGIAPSANINPEKRFPSMFEPVHGSAPDIAGKGIANPTAQIWCASLMLEDLGETEAARLVMDAIESVLTEGQIVTPDLGGKASTQEMGSAICSQIRKLGQ